MKELIELIRAARVAVNDAVAEAEDDADVPEDTLDYLYDADNALREALDALPQAE
jgi:hypothetical protein